MKKTYQIKINQGKESQTLDIPMAGTKGQAVTVKAVSGARYQLVDTTTNYGPENIRVSRQGKDMKVSFEGSNTTDLVIEDYYKVSPDGYNGLIGEAESGKFYEYIPESASGMASVPMLADAGPAVGMALGGSEVAASGAAVGLLAAGLFSPWLLGAGALGVAAAAGGGGSSSSAAKDTTPPNGGAAVGLTIDLDSGNDGVINAVEKGSVATTSLTATFDKNTVNAGDVITFSDGVNSKSVTLTAADVAAGKVTSQGWTLPSEGSTLNVTAVLKDPSGNATNLATDTAKIDTTPPASQTGALFVDKGSDSGKLGDNLTSITKPTITGKAEASSTVEVSFRDPANKLIGPYKTTADANGNYSLQVPNDLLDTSTDTKGTKYTPVIKATDAAGNSSTADGTPFVVDTKALDLILTIDADSNNNGVISYIENGNSATTPKDLNVTAKFDKTKANVGDEVHFQLPGGSDNKVTLTQAMVDAGQAVFSFVKGIVDAAVLKVSAWFVDTALNQSATAIDEATVDLSVKVNVTSIAGDDMINQAEALKPISVNGTATASGTVWLKVSAVVVGSATVGTDGTWSAEVLTSNLKGATSLSAELKSASGNTSLATDPSHSYSVDLSADASTVGQTLTALENLAYKSSSTGIWTPLKSGAQLTDSGAYSLSDASGNLYKPPSTTAADQVVAYSALNTSHYPATSSELTVSQLLASSDGLHIDYASLVQKTIDPAVKSVNLADGKASIMSIDTLDVLNHGVLNVLQAGLGQNPQFKVFGDASGDILKLTNLLGGKGIWTESETVTLVGDAHTYTHYSAYALGLEIDLLVDKNIQVNIV